jgi:DNA repair protein RadD
MSAKSTPHKRLMSPEALHSIEAESALLGGILVNNECYRLVSNFLSPEHFYVPDNRQIFEIVSGRINGGERVSPLVASAFNIEGLDVEQYVIQLCVQATTILNAEYYGREIYDLAMRRRAIERGEGTPHADRSREWSSSPSIVPTDCEPSELEDGHRDAESRQRTEVVQLWSYQIGVIERCRQQCLAGVSRICLVAPTGSGKTVIAVAVIQAARAKDKSVVVIGHTREIVKQISDKLRKAGVEHGIIMSADTVGSYEAVPVASVQTYWSRVIKSKRIEPPAADLVIVDECHHIRARTWQQIVESYPDATVIGLTATPCRSDGRGLGAIFDAMVECPQVPELIKLGCLVPTKTYAPAESALDLGGINTSNGDYVVSELADRVNTDPLVGDIITHWHKYAAGLETIVFAVNVAHSRHIANEFLKAGISAEHLDGSTPKKERDAILARLAAGDTQVVVNCKVLTEGFDLPDVACIVLARPTKQQGLYRQMVGRGLRPAKGKKCLVILDHSGAIYRHGRIEDPIEWTLAPDERAANRAHTAGRLRDTDGSYQSRIVDCKSCGAKRVSGEACVHCGWYPKRGAEAIVFDDGDLQLYDPNSRTAKPAVDPNERARWHAMLVHIAQQRCYKPGWAAHKFKEKFGVWPARGYPAPQEPSPEVLSWIRSRDIAYAKARQKRGAA